MAIDSYGIYDRKKKDWVRIGKGKKKGEIIKSSDEVHLVSSAQKILKKEGRSLLGNRNKNRFFIKKIKIKK